MTTAGNQSSERGHALLVVTLISVLALTLWLVTWGSTGSLVRAEGYADRMADRDAGPLRAVAAGVDLLRTGLPPAVPYSCIYQPGGTAAPCTLTFREGDDEDTWHVDAELATTEEQASLPETPATFAD
ncbi:MAG: hypothetical protein QNJ98_18015 [Planctomycetota bacterium]|nr:hypothetical protein [Planctomycetota bacterium]